MHIVRKNNSEVRADALIKKWRAADVQKATESVNNFLKNKKAALLQTMTA